jgi:ubiquinone/menaquinone biosynthesis C-methylase UbiE
MRLPYAWLDPWVARRPFEGRAARRYAVGERPAFGDLDDRLLERLHAELALAERFLDVGAGTGALAARIARAYPRLDVVAVEPSASFTRGAGAAGVTTLRARAEALPLGPALVDVALCLSSLRHARDRRAALAELRRVVRPGGVAWIVELDPAADRARAARHRRALRSPLARLTFDPLLLRSGPGAHDVAAAARAAGWSAAPAVDDARQPFFLIRLS